MELTGEHLSKRKRTGVLISIAFASFIYPFMISGLAVALPAIGENFQISPGELGLVETSYLAAIIILLVPAGKLADKVGLTRIYITGMILYAVTSISLGFSGSFLMLLALRFLQGFSVAMLTATGIAILTSIFPANKRGYVLGVTIGAVYVGLSAGPFIGGLITEKLGWKYIFLIGGGLSVIALLLVLITLPIKKQSNNKSFNYRSALLYVLFVSMIWTGYSKIHSGFIFALILFAGLLGFAYYLVVEYKSQNPIIEVRLFLTNRPFLLGTSLTLINYAASVAVTFCFSLYLQYVKGLNPQQTGIILVIQPIIQSVFAPVSGRLSDRYNPNLMVLYGMLSCFIGLVIVLFINAQSPMYLIYSLLPFFGLGFALFSSANTNQVMSSVSRQYYGVASSMVGAMRTIGMLTSISIASGLLTYYLGDKPMSTGMEPLFINGMRLSFIIFTLISFLGLVLSYTLFKLDRKSNLTLQ